MTQDNKQELYKELQTWHSGQEVTQMSKQEIGNIQKDLEPLPWRWFSKTAVLNSVKEKTLSDHVKLNNYK